MEFRREETVNKLLLALDEGKGKVVLFYVADTGRGNKITKINLTRNIHDKDVDSGCPLCWLSENNYPRNEITVSRISIEPLASHEADVHCLYRNYWDAHAHICRKERASKWSQFTPK